MIEIVNSLIHNTLYITIIFVIITAVVAMFVKGRKKDKCLNDFAKSMITHNCNILAKPSECHCERAESGCGNLNRSIT